MAETTDFTALQTQFAGYIRNPEVVTAPEQIEPRRMAIYRDLFFNNIDGSISSAFPVIRSLYSDAEWQHIIRDFMIKHRCKTPVFFELAREFVDYLSNEREQQQDPAFLSELAHYEWVELALSVAEHEFSKSPQTEAEQEAVYKRSALAWVVSYHYAVHEISADNQIETPLPQPVFFLIYRNEADEVKFVELNLVSARLLDLLQQGQPLIHAVTQIADELQHPQPDLVLQGAKVLVTDWLQQGVLLKQ